MQLRERGRGRMAPFEQAAAEDQHTVDQKQHADEEPYLNDFVSFAHSRFSLTLANPFCHSERSEESALLGYKEKTDSRYLRLTWCYQKMICSTISKAIAARPQNSGRWNRLVCCS